LRLIAARNVHYLILGFDLALRLGLASRTNGEDTAMKRFAQIGWIVPVAILFVVFAAQARAGEIKGKIRSVDPNTLTFVMENDGRMTDVQMDEDAQVLINEREGSVADLRRGDNVIVMGRLDGGVLLAVEVRCRRQ
jgi:hypothetical protein